MLDMTEPVFGFAETIQKIYDFQTDGLPLEESLGLIIRETAACGGQITLAGRDGATPRVLAGRVSDGDEVCRLSVEIPTRDQSQRYLLVLTRPAGHAFTPYDSSMARDLMRHFVRARELMQRIDSQSAEAQIYGNVLDRLAVGAIFVDARGTILRAAGIAEAVLGQREGLRNFRGMVSAMSGQCDRRLQQALRSALDPADPAGAQMQSLVVQRPDGLHGLGLVIQRLSNHGEAAAVILIRDPQRSGEPEKAMLRSLFDLTPAEAELARSLTAGNSLDESAAALSISRNTARAHLRAIFSKSGITRQTELMRLMLNSAAMLGQAPKPVAA